MDEQLQQLIDLQKEQNQLLKRYLWRLRFSLYALLLLTTAVAVGLGFVAYQTRPTTAVPVFTPLPGPPLKSRQFYSPAPAGDIEVDPAIPGTS